MYAARWGRRTVTGNAPALLHGHSKQMLGTRPQLTQRSSNRLWLCYFCSLTLGALENDILFLIISGGVSHDIMASCAEFACIYRNYVQTYNIIINLGYIFSLKNGYICSKQTNKIYCNRRH